MKSTNIASVPSVLEAAIKLLASKGMRITQVAVSRELAQRMIDCRQLMDDIGPSPVLLSIDTEFDIFLPARDVNPDYLVSKPDNFIGVMFNIDVLID